MLSQWRDAESIIMVGFRRCGTGMTSEVNARRPAGCNLRRPVDFGKQNPVLRVLAALGGIWHLVYQTGSKSHAPAH